MPANSIAENVLGTMGAIFWTIQLLPQIWKSWKSKDTEGLSPWLVLFWGISGSLLGVYSIVRKLNIPLIVQPQLFGFLSLISWGQCQHYGKRRSSTVSILMVVALFAVLGGFQGAVISVIQPIYPENAHADRAIQFFGIFSAVLISLSLLPQYYEIYKHKEVIGISILFMLIDLLGGVFSDLSLAFKENFDVVAGITYSVVVVMDGVVIVAAVILNPRARRRRQREAALLPSTAEVTDTSVTRDPITLSRRGSNVETPMEPGTASISTGTV